MSIGLPATSNATVARPGVEGAAVELSIVMPCLDEVRNTWHLYPEGSALLSPSMGSSAR